MRERKCGCILYEYGPPFKCPKHQSKLREREEKSFRKVVSEHVASLGHDLTRWEEYESKKGKWTSFCKHCGDIAIVYDEPQSAVDQVISHMLSQPCRRSSLVEDVPNGQEAQVV